MDEIISYKEFLFTQKVLNDVIKYFKWYVKTSEFYKTLKEMSKINTYYKDTNFWDFHENGYKLYDDYQQKIHLQMLKIFNILIGRTSFYLFLKKYIDGINDHKIGVYIYDYAGFTIYDYYDDDKEKNKCDKHYKERFIKINRILQMDINKIKL